jgi:hypothetical protein
VQQRAHDLPDGFYWCGCVSSNRLPWLSTLFFLAHRIILMLNDSLPKFAAHGRSAQRGRERKDIFIRLGANHNYCNMVLMPRVCVPQDWLVRLLVNLEFPISAR